MSYKEELEKKARELDYAVVMTPFCPSCQEYKELARLWAISVPCTFKVQDGKEVEKAGYLIMLCDSCRPNIKSMVDDTIFWVTTGTARVAICG